MPTEVIPFSLFDWLRGALPLVGLYVRLYKGSHNQNTFPAIGEFQEADFAGYEGLLFEKNGSAVRDGRGTWTVASEILGWTVLDEESLENTLGGYYVVAKMPDGSEQLVVWEDFKQARVMAQFGDTFSLVVTLTARQSRV